MKICLKGYNSCPLKWISFVPVSQKWASNDTSSRWKWVTVARF